MNNKECLIDLPRIQAKNLVEALLAIEAIQTILIKHAVSGHFEEEFSEGGVELEINENAEIMDYSFDLKELN